MKKIVTFLFILFLLSNICFSQSGWFQLNTPTIKSIWAIYFTNAYTGFIGLDSGKIFRTTDGGNNWLPQSITTTNAIINCCFVNQYTGYATSYNEFFKSTNGGINWFELNIPYASFLDDIFFTNETTGYLADEPYVLKTTNGGLAWDTILPEVSVFSVEVYCVYFITPSIGLAGGSLDISPHTHLLRIWRTTNSGQNWTIAYNASGTAFDDIYFSNNNIGYAVGSSSYMAKTTNGGVSWYPLNFSGGYTHFYTVSSISEIKVFTCGVYGLWISANGGSNWSNVQIPNVAYYSMHFPDSVVGYVAGQYGYIYKTTNGGIPIGINEINNRVPLSPSLSQNYPNPFNPVTKIKYDIPPSQGARGMMTKLIIYDVLGREIETLVNETQKPGSYEVTWDGSRYASGVYFYRLITDDYAETKKMVLIK